MITQNADASARLTVSLPATATSTQIKTASWSLSYDATSAMQLWYSA